MATVTLQMRNSRQYMVTLPKAVVRALQWKPGQQIQCTLISPKRLLLSRALSGSLLQYANNRQFLLTLPKSIVEGLSFQVGKQLSCRIHGMNIALGWSE